MAHTTPQNVRAVFQTLLAEGKRVFQAFPRGSDEAQIAWGLMLTAVVEQINDMVLPALHDQAGLENDLAELVIWKDALAEIGLGDRIDDLLVDHQVGDAYSGQQMSGRRPSADMEVEEAELEGDPGAVPKTNLAAVPERMDGAGTPAENAGEVAIVTDEGKRVEGELFTLNVSFHDTSHFTADETESHAVGRDPSELVRKRRREVQSPITVESGDESDVVMIKPVEQPSGAPRPVELSATPSPSPSLRQSPDKVIGGGNWREMEDGTIIWTHLSKLTENKTPYTKHYTNARGVICSKCQTTKANCLTHRAMAACWRCYSQKVGCSLASKEMKASAQGAVAAGPPKKKTKCQEAPPAATVYELSDSGNEADNERAKRERIKEAERALDDAEDVVVRALQNLRSRKRNYVEAVDATWDASKD
ncbi:hypothetical protein BD410DRAFT_846523 [Rickenella mellea]|uniref:Uncharacterized protein n=1 Tax=Rickenella mellea TaxID=50990 RepID=A0A4Y7PEW9_9AGAM|nr:hypothetical protein BD410DRAFT_846523 [Rickenella mellea]